MSFQKTIVEGRYYFEKRVLRPTIPGNGHIPIPGLIFDPESQQPMSKSLLEGLYYVPKEVLGKKGSRSARSETPFYHYSNLLAVCGQSIMSGRRHRRSRTDFIALNRRMTSQYSRYLQAVRTAGAGTSDRTHGTPVSPFSRPLSAAAPGSVADQFHQRPSTRADGTFNARPAGPGARPASAPPSRHPLYRPAGGRAGIDRTAIDAAVAAVRSRAASRPGSRSDDGRMPTPG